VNRDANHGREEGNHGHELGGAHHVLAAVDALAREEARTLEQDDGQGEHQPLLEEEGEPVVTAEEGERGGSESPEAGR
jgi:hypothetical protein